MDNNEKGQLAPMDESLEAERKRLEEINKDIQENGLAVLADLPIAERIKAYRYKKRDQEHAGIMLDATFSILGDLEGMAVWGDQNKHLFYPLYLKYKTAMAQALASGKSASGTQIVIQTNVPAGPLDHGIYTIDVEGGAPLEGDDDE